MKTTTYQGNEPDPDGEDTFTETIITPEGETVVNPIPGPNTPVEEDDEEAKAKK